MTLDEAPNKFLPFAHFKRKEDKSVAKSTAMWQWLVGRKMGSTARVADGWSSQAMKSQVRQTTSACLIPVLVWHYNRSIKQLGSVPILLNVFSFYGWYLYNLLFCKAGIFIRYILHKLCRVGTYKALPFYRVGIYKVFYFCRVGTCSAWPISSLWETRTSGKLYQCWRVLLVWGFSTLSEISNSPSCWVPKIFCMAKVTYIGLDMDADTDIYWAVFRWCIYMNVDSTHWINIILARADMLQSQPILKLSRWYNIVTVGVYQNLNIHCKMCELLHTKPKLRQVKSYSNQLSSNPPTLAAILTVLTNPTVARFQPSSPQPLPTC